jgi:hypothetical protein
VVKVHYDEGVAIHIGPEPCVGVREDGDEASGAEQGKSYGRAAQRAFLPLRASLESATYRPLYREVRG